VAADTVKSTSITNLDATPYIQNTTGEGAPGYQRVVDDYVAVTSAGIATIASYYKVVRVPASAKVKSVVVAESTELDTHNADTLVFDVNWIWSDSTIDGTPGGVQGLIPQRANTGTTTSIASYTTPNLIYGQITPVYNAVYGPTDVVFNGSRTYYPFVNTDGSADPGLTTSPLWDLFGFSYDQGFFDLMLYVSTAASTGAAGYLYVRVSYVD